MIRPAVLDDVPALVEMGMRFHAGSAYEHLLQPNRDVVSESLKKLILFPSGIVFVLDQDGGLRGAVIGLVAPHFISGLPIASELAWWVDPDYRGGSGLKLLAAFEDRGRELGATMGSACEPPGNEIVGAMLQRRGYALSEKTYTRAL